MAQRVKHPPAMRETWVRSLGLEKEMATHSSVLAWRIPWIISEHISLRIDLGRQKLLIKRALDGESGDQLSL